LKRIIYHFLLWKMRLTIMSLTVEFMPGYAVPTRPFGVRKTTHTFVYSFV
jgi:hypothetical protein